MPASAPTITVHVVDDDRDVLTSLKFLLETEGFQVLTFKSGPELLNATIVARADCYVIDYRMPHMNGIDLAGRLRARSNRRPIILITGDPDKTLSERAAGAGFQHVLLKPHVEESLVSLIAAAVATDRIGTAVQ